MGRLLQQSALRFHELIHETVVGRASGATLRIAQPYVSSQHATLRYSEKGRWELRDLLSKNGTYLDGVRVAAGSAVKLELGSVLGFGSLSDPYVLEDVSPPRPMLLALSQESAPIFLTDILVGLPNPDDPEVSLFRAESGQWHIDSRELAGPLNDGDVIRISQEQWRCCLPAARDETEALGVLPCICSLSEIELILEVSRDEENVELTVRTKGRKLGLGTKACYYLLLTLARCRGQRDLLPSIEVSADGWIGVGSLLELLRISEQRLNVDIFRIRQELKAAGVVDAAAIVERDTHKRLLRLATERVTITRQT